MQAQQPVSGTNRLFHRLCRLLPVLLMAALGGFVLALSSCATVTRTVVQTPPAIEGADFVGNKTCAECHTNQSRTFAVSPHARVATAHAKPGDFSCEQCHGPGSLHVKAGGGRGGLIVNPGRSPQACFSCHQDIHAEFRLPAHHPVLEGHMNCVQCHDPHGRDIFKPAGGTALSRVNQQCADCHREQSKPHIYEHEAMREGCTTCHRPHGSPNAKMLVERDQNLCLKCHAQTQAPGGGLFIGKVNHAVFPNMTQGTCWSAGCHNAVHGSNLNPHLRY